MTRSSCARAGRFVALGLLACLAGCTASTADKPGGAGAAAAGGGRYVLLMNGNSPFWDAVRAGMDKAAADLGVNAVLETNDATPAGQIEKLRQFGTQADIVAVGISATDAANVAIADQLRKLREKGVVVLTIDSDLDRQKFRDARAAFVGTDNLAGGRELGIAAKGLRPDGGAFVQFVGRTGAQNAIERMDGFVQGAGEKFKELDRMGDENDRTRARDNVRNAIRNHPDVNTLVGIWSYNAPAIADVVRELGKRQEMTIVAFDAEPNAIEQMGTGDIDAMIVQNPFEMGYQGIRLMQALVNDDQAAVAEMLPNFGQPEGDIIDTGLKVVVPDEGSPLEPEQFSGKTEYLKLSDFKAWLAKYGLTGS
ncbi:MAG: substrate-binding domain-containing protein [Pirellulales bacterium]|nr:substrate-binding domain-containing protein [Pirellulales bacterium]